MTEHAVTPELLRRTTAPALLCERARQTPERVAFRSKHLGLYRERSFHDYAGLVARAAKALVALGLAKGERVAIMGDACEEWIVCDLAAQSLGAIVYGIYPTASSTEVEYQMRNGGAAIFIAEDQEYVDKIWPLIDQLPDLRSVVVIDDSAMFDYDHPKLTSLEKILAPVTGDIAWLETQVARLSPDDPAFIVYTSGTSGHPKGALVGHGKHLAATANLADTYPTLYRKEHRTVAYLPLCHILGRDVAVTLPLFTRLVPHFGEHPEDLAATLFETAPTVLFTVPRYLQKFASQVLVAILNSSKLKRLSYHGAMRFARARAKRRWSGNVGYAQEALYRFWHTVTLRPILSKLGFDRLELVVSGGAPLPAETMALWHMFGVNTVEIYGQTETAGGIITGQRGLFAAPGDVGTVAKDIEIRLASDGEVQVRSPYLFEGYWHNEAATRELQTEDGFWRTGDIGEWRNGRLRLVDRARDFLVTLGGKTIAPSLIENGLRGSPYIAEAIIFGQARKYLTALIEIDFDTVADWARGNNIAYTGFTSLATNPRVQKLIQGELDKTNAEFARVEQIKAFRILQKTLDPEEEGEPVTPTRKVKRALMYERFKALVEEMYDDREGRLLAGEVGGVLRA